MHILSPANSFLVLDNDDGLKTSSIVIVTRKNKVFDLLDIHTRDRYIHYKRSLHWCKRNKWGEWLSGLSSCATTGWWVNDWYKCLVDSFVLNLLTCIFWSSHHLIHLKVTLFNCNITETDIFVPGQFQLIIILGSHHSYLKILVAFNYMNYMNAITDCSTLVCLCCYFELVSAPG